MRAIGGAVALVCLSLAAVAQISPDVRDYVKLDSPVIAITHARVIDGDDRLLLLHLGNLLQDEVLAKGAGRRFQNVLLQQPPLLGDLLLGHTVGPHLHDTPI